MVGQRGSGCRRWGGSRPRAPGEAVMRSEALTRPTRCGSTCRHRVRGSDTVSHSHRRHLQWDRPPLEVVWNVGHAGLQSLTRRGRQLSATARTRSPGEPRTIRAPISQDSVHTLPTLPASGISSCGGAWMDGPQRLVGGGGMGSCRAVERIDGGRPVHRLVAPQISAGA